MKLKTDLVTTFLIIFSVYDFLRFFTILIFSDESLIQKVNVKLLKFIYFLLT